MNINCKGLQTNTPQNVGSKENLIKLINFVRHQSVLLMSLVATLIFTKHGQHCRILHVSTWYIFAEQVFYRSYVLRHIRLRSFAVVFICYLKQSFYIVCFES